jgi:hypothetical protein
MTPPNPPHPHTIWQRLDDRTERLLLPLGWLVRSTVTMGFDGGAAVHQIYVHDPTHSWLTLRTEADPGYTVDGPPNVLGGDR